MEGGLCQPQARTCCASANLEMKQEGLLLLTKSEALIPLYKRNKNDVSLLLVGEKTSLSGITPKGFSGAEMLCRVWQESAVQRGRTWEPA